MSTAADYAGRTYDVCAFHGLTARGESLLTHELADAGGGEICTGAAKLAQRVVLRLLTPRGSIRFSPREGCDFVTLARTGQLRTEAAASTAFRFAAGLIQSACAAEIVATTPPDEQLVRIDLLGIAFLADAISVTIEIVTAAGTTRPIILPIRTRP